jgi:outer membrane lipopolysaccharide assembly protein LptE/RlpB
MRTINLLCVFIFTAALLSLPACDVHTEKAANGEDKNVDIQTPVGNLHVGNDVDVRDAGLSVYPGARLRPKSEDKDNDSANLSISTEAFGLKVVAAEYTSDDSPDKITAYYRSELKKYGTVIDCHSEKHGNNVNVHSDDKSNRAGPVSCESPNTGNVLELKVGTENNQHIVSVEPQAKGTDFSLVYVKLRGKQGDI